MAALYDPRYDYPSDDIQRAFGSKSVGLRNSLLRELYPDTVPPVLTEAQKHAILTEPAVNMHYDANNNLVPANTDSINAYQGDIVSNDTAALPTRGETLDNRRSGILMNQDPARYLRDGSSLDDGMGNIYRLEAGDKDDVFQSLVKRYLDEGFGQKEAEAKANEQMEKSRLQLLKENAGALASSINTSVLAAGSDGSGSNRLTNLLSGLSRDAIGFAKDVRQHGITLTWNGNTIFATDGENTVPVTEETAVAINDANNDGTAQAPSQQSGPMGMSFNPPVPALASPNESGTGNGTGNTVVTDNTGPVLRQPTSNTARNGNAARRMTGGYTGNARGSALPDMQIGLNERLMRMGAAGLAAGGQGSLAQMGAMFGASADVNQANRQAEMEAFGIEEERRQAHADRVAALAASKNKGAGGGDMDKLKDFQAKNFGFYNRGVQAEKALLEVGEIGTDVFELLKSNVPLIGNNLVDPKFQRYDQARRNFVNAVLRRESGAVISDAEFENANIQYFPQPFDSAETIAQKQQNRRATMEGIRMGAGPSIFYTSSYPMAGGGSVKIDVGDGETYEVKTAPRKDKQ